MPNSSLLFVDLLGTKSRWGALGRDAVEDACRRFSALVISALTDGAGPSVLHGGVETDSAAILCDSPAAAVALGRDMFRRAFASAESRHDTRMWLRGAIVPCGGDVPLREEKQLTDACPQVVLHGCSDGLMDGIAVEKSGYKGMRLLLYPDLFSLSWTSQFGIAFGSGTLYPFRRLKFSPYAKGLEEYQDVLWMVPDKHDEWGFEKLRMATRLRWAAATPDEFIQAAATQVVFHECAAIVDDVTRRAAS